MGSIYEVDADLFLPTPFSKFLTQSIVADGFPFLQDVIEPATYKIHEHLARSHYKNPENGLDCAFQIAHNTTSHYFQWMQDRPAMDAMFNNHMTATHAGLSHWTDPHKFPLEERLIKGASTDPEAVFFVDVGGGNGHDIQELCRQYPRLEARIILQEQASVIADLASKNLDPRIHPIEHNFFQKQPIKGARAYHMHRIVHDWPDSKCHEILTQLRNAMVKGYSKLLLYEMVIPDRGAQGTSTGLDLLMMSLFAACERTNQGWKTLLEGAGFRIVKIWPIEPASESLIEAELA